jgi:peptidoglycan/xylan/chitin deacetylase (PgdA/CDA1 family)
VAAIQRTDGAMRLNVHAHVLALDGVYVRDGPEGPLAFHPLPAPTHTDVTEVAWRTAARIERILRAHGRRLEGERPATDRCAADFRATRNEGGRHRSAAPVRAIAEGKMRMNSTFSAHHARSLLQRAMAIALGSVAVFAAREARADPFPSPQNAGQLACDLAPGCNPNYATWWNAVRDNPAYQNWFWNSIVPLGTSDASSCPNAGAQVRDVFWNQAVPENWSWTGDIGGWPFGAGGYFTQTLWLRAVPENWAWTGDIGGWPFGAGGYYTQTMWLLAIPDNWATIGNIGGWPWSSGGYYTQWFWLHAVPDDWGPRTGVLPSGPYAQFTGSAPSGYYQYHFWSGAVPGNWRTIPNVGGWPWASGGYYTQWFWLHAAPDQWAAEPFTISGTDDRGYYDAWFYHFATMRDFAWDPNKSLGGTSGAGYYDFWWHDGRFANATTTPLNHYHTLLEEAGGYVKPSTDKVSSWFDSMASAVVILTFDTESDRNQSCAMTSMLKGRGVPATFFLIGATAAAIGADSVWKSCFSDGTFDFGNHTESHPGTVFLTLPSAGAPIDPSVGLFDTFAAPVEASQIADGDATIRATFPGSSVSTFRTPWCDGHKSFDASVVRALASFVRAGSTSQVVKADSSVAYVSQAAQNAGTTPHKALRTFSVGAANPYPFRMSAAGKTVVEFPFAYPSDWAARDMHGLDENGKVAVWKSVFDEVRSKNGVMVLLMHPWISTPTAVAQIIDYMSSKPNVRFTTMAEASRRYRAFKGLSP